MHQAYQALRPGLMALRDDGQRPDTAHWPAFAALYRTHIELEERAAYPVTRADCAAGELAAMGQEMAARRQ